MVDSFSHIHSQNNRSGTAVSIFKSMRGGSQELLGTQTGFRGGSLGVYRLVLVLGDGQGRVETQ